MSAPLEILGTEMAEVCEDGVCAIPDIPPDAAS